MNLQDFVRQMGEGVLAQIDVDPQSIEDEIRRERSQYIRDFSASWTHWKPEAWRRVLGGFYRSFLSRDSMLEALRFAKTVEGLSRPGERWQRFVELSIELIHNPPAQTERERRSDSGRPFSEWACFWVQLMAATDLPMTRNRVKVALLLAQNADDDGQVHGLTVRVMSGETQMTENSFSNVLGFLIDEGWLDKRRSGTSKKAPNSYTLLIPQDVLDRAESGELEVDSDWPEVAPNE